MILYKCSLNSCHCVSSMLVFIRSSKDAINSDTAFNNEVDLIVCLFSCLFTKQQVEILQVTYCRWTCHLHQEEDFKLLPLHHTVVLWRPLPVLNWYCGGLIRVSKEIIFDHWIDQFTFDFSVHIVGFRMCNYVIDNLRRLYAYAKQHIAHYSCFCEMY